MAARTNLFLLAFLGWTALASVLDIPATAAPAPAPPPPPGAAKKAVSIAALNRLLKEADAAMEAKDFGTAITKTEELIKSLNPQTASDEQMERLYFNVGLAHLLAEHFPEAETAFTDCATKYPKGLMASRCALGVGKACIGQDTPPKKELALKVLKVAMADPKLNAEAGLALGQLYSDLGKRKEALDVFKSLMGADIRTPGQTTAAVGVVNLLADGGQIDDLVYYLDRLTNQAGVRDAICWYTNQVIVRGDDEMMSGAFDTALAIFQTVPSRNQILDTQTQALESQRKTLAILEKTIAREDEAERANPNVPINRSVARELVGSLNPAIDANEKALTAIQGIKDLDASLVMRRGRCFFHLKRNEEARVCFSTMRLKYPTYKDCKLAAFTEIMIMQDLKKSAGLLELCKAYLTAYPDSEDAEPVATLAGEMLVEKAKWEEVGPYYADLETRFPKSTNMDRFIFYQAFSKFLTVGDKSDFALSTPLFEKIVRTYPKSQFYEPSLYHLAMTYFLSNEYKKTIAACGDYLAKYPNGPYAGDMQYRLSFVDSNDKTVPPDKIIGDLEGFLTAHPDDVSNGSMECLLGDTYKKKADDEKKTADERNAAGAQAVEAYKKAVWSKSPDDVIQYALDAATTILQARKEWDDIAALHGQFLKEKPDSQLALLSAGMVVKMYNRQGKGEEGAAVLADALRARISNPTIQQVEYLLDLMVQTLVPRKKPAKEEIEAVAVTLDQQLVDALTKVVGDKPNPTATARIFYAQARLSQLLYRASRTDRSDLLLKGIATNYAADPSVLSPTLLSVCGDILLQDGDLDAAQAMYKRLNDSYKDSLFSDAGPLGLGNVALARKQPEEALKIFEDILVNNKGTSKFKETTLGKLQALVDLGRFDDARALAKNIVGDKMFHGEMAGKANLMLADSYRVEAAQAAPGAPQNDLLHQAYAAYKVICISYQSLPEICAEAYWQAAETAKTLNEYGLASEDLRTLMNHPKLQNTKRGKEAKEKAL